MRGIDGLTWAMTSDAFSAADLTMSTDTPRLTMPRSSGGVNCIDGSETTNRQHFPSHKLSIGSRGFSRLSNPSGRYQRGIKMSIRRSGGFWVGTRTGR